MSYNLYITKGKENIKIQILDHFVRQDATSVGKHSDIHEAIVRII